MQNNNLFLTAEWRKLVMANYAVEPELLEKYVPSRTQLDLWEGKCYVSLVAFMFNNTRVKNFSIPFHKDFEEVNLRFYVKYQDGDNQKRGVVFIREFVPLPFVTMVANLFYDERYQTLPMRHKWHFEQETAKVIYEWKKHQWHSIEIDAVNNPQLIIPGSKEEFITQHFWGYARRKNHTSEYEVKHEVWKSYPVTQYKIEVNFHDCYGPEFKFLNKLSAESVFLVEGSEIEVYRDKKILAEGKNPIFGSNY